MKLIGWATALVLGTFLGAQVIGAAIVFWPVTLVLLYWWIET